MRTMLLKLTCVVALVLSLGVTASASTSYDGQALAAIEAATLSINDQELGLPGVDQEFGEEAAEEVAEEAAAEEDPNAFDEAIFRTDNLWILIAAFLVFIMHLGFATLETGLTQAKNTVNILFKNTFIICIGLLTYAICGFNLMYPGFADDSAKIFGFAGFGIPGIAEIGNPDYINPTLYGLDMTTWADFIFQGMFAATAATIISGCVAERIKLLPFLVFTTIYVGFLYPWLGSWKWGGGWLADKGFVDFAGSTLVHSVGGWGGLAAILVLGPRKGKYVDGKVRPILPSNLPLATIGVFLLWFGWFGFNGGSVLNADPASVSYVVTTTSIAAAIGGLVAGTISWLVGGKPDLTMALNGILAGLVGITAGPDTSLTLTCIIGVVCGVAVYFSVLALDAIKIDDPVGALSVHLTCGIIGTLFAAFSDNGGDGGSLGVQFLGVISYGIVAFVFALVLALIVKAIFGFRVSEEEETEGLDAGEHGMLAYHGLSIK